MEKQEGRMARSDLIKFWKLLTDANFTDSPSKLTEDEVRQMAKTLGLFEPEIGAAIRGFREMLGTEKMDGTLIRGCSPLQPCRYDQS
jgi:hypothetical protein